MLENMKVAVVSLIYKDKGTRDDYAKYRPIAVSSLVYRILAKAMVIAIRPLLHTITSSCQKAFKAEDVIGDSTRLVQDVIRYYEQSGEKGMLLFADQDNAYPRVEWDYMLEVLETMNIHNDFIDIVKSMYNGVELRFKLNGTKANATVQPTNGIAQGCPLSPCLYLLCLQGLLSMKTTITIRGNSRHGTFN